MQIQHSEWWPVHEMVKSHAYKSFSTMGDFERYLTEQVEYTDHCILRQDEESISVILYRYGYASTALGYFGERYPIRWLTDTETIEHLSESIVREFLRTVFYREN